MAPPSCAEGWALDLFLFHDPSPPAPCVPAAAFKFVFLEVAVISGGLIVLALLRIRAAKADARRLLSAVIFSQLMVAATALALWLQGGLFEGAAIGALAFIVSTTQVGRLLLGLALNPAVSLGVKKEQLALVTGFYSAFSAVMLVGVAAAFFALAWASRQEDATYNLVAIIIMLSLTFYISSIAGGLLFHLVRLERAITQISLKAPRVRQSQNSALPSKLDAFNSKIKRLNVHVGIFLLATAPVLFSVGVTFLVLGYFPYGIAVITILLNAVSFVTFNIWYLLGSRRQLGNADSRNNSKMVLTPGSSSVQSAAGGVAAGSSA